jgi:hypothetical protein
VHRGAFEFSSQRREGSIAIVAAPVWGADPAVWSGLAGTTAIAVGRPTVRAPWPPQGRHIVALLSEIREEGALVIFDCFEVDEDLLRSLRSPSDARGGRHAQWAAWAGTPIGIEIDLLDSSGQSIWRGHRPFVLSGGRVETIASAAAALPDTPPRRLRANAWFFTDVQFAHPETTQRVDCALIGPWFLATEPLGPSRPRQPRGGWTGPRDWPVAWRGPTAWFTTAVEQVVVTLPYEVFERITEARVAVR